MTAFSKASLCMLFLYAMNAYGFQAYNILLLQPYAGSKSQRMFFTAFLTPLAERGHNV